MKTTFQIDIKRGGSWFYLTEFATKTDANKFVSSYGSVETLRVRNNTTY